MKLDLFQKPTKETVELAVSQMNLSPEEREAISTKISKIKYEEDSIFSLADVLFINAPTYKSIKDLLSNEDCLKILNTKSARNFNKNEARSWPCKDFEIVGDFFLDVAQRAKADQSLDQYMKWQFHSVGDTFGFIFSAETNWHFSQESFLRGLDKIRKARGFKGSVEEMISSDIDFVSGSSVDGEKFKNIILRNCLFPTHKHEILHKAAINAFEGLKHKQPNSFNDLIDAENGDLEYWVKDLFENQSAEMLDKTLAALESAKAIKNSSDTNYLGVVLKRYSEWGLSVGEPTQITKEFKDLLKYERFSGLKRIQKSAALKADAQNKLNEEDVHLIKRSLDHKDGDSISIYNFPIKDILLLFKEIELFDQSYANQANCCIVRDQTKIGSTLCLIAKFMADSRKEIGLDDFSQSKELPSLEIIDHFPKIISNKIDKEIAEQNYDPKDIQKIKGGYDQFASWIERKYILNATESPEDDRPRKRSVNKI